MSFFNDEARLGLPYKINGGGQRFNNNTGATISRGQCVAVDIGETRSAYQRKSVIANTSTNQQYPVVVAAADVASLAEGTFYSEGVVLAQVATSVTALGSIVCAGTANATGGNSFITSGTTNRNAAGFIDIATGQGSTTLVPVVLFGSNPPTNR